MWCLRDDANANRVQPPTEEVVACTASLTNRVRVMRERDFTRLFIDFERSAFRLETLPEYQVAGERDEFASFLAGGSRPSGLNAEWLEIVARSTSSGRSFERVHAVPSVLTPYLEFEFTWGYAHSAQAGERIFILQSDQPQDVFGDLPYVDFWLFDDAIAVEMHYEDDGRFRHAHEIEHSEIERYRKSREVAKESSQPFEEYLAHTTRA